MDDDDDENGGYDSVNDSGSGNEVGSGSESDNGSSGSGGGFNSKAARSRAAVAASLDDAGEPARCYLLCSSVATAGSMKSHNRC